MYGQPPPFSHRGGGRGQPPPQQQAQPHMNPNYLLNNNYYLQPPNFPMFPNFPVENPNIHTQNLNLPIENPNFHMQNHNFSIENPSFHMQNHSFTPHNQLSNNRVIPHNGTMEKIDKAVVKARRELIVAGENVSALKVSQAALVILQADSWDSLGVQMQHVPCLYRLMLIEGKINALIHCFVEVWKITTLFDLEMAICKNEGVQQFEELELGPLIRHPLINHYFCVSSDSTAVFKISSREIISFLVEYMDIHKGKEVLVNEFLDFIANKRSVDSKEKLHVRIQSLGMHITLIRKAKPLENATISKYLESSGKQKKTRPLFTSQKKQLDENFGAISQRLKSFSSENGKHIRFLSSSEDEGVDVESDENEDETCLTSQSKSKSKSKKSSRKKKRSNRVSTCPYPSVNEEKTRLGITSEKEEKPNEAVASVNKKRKSDEIACNDFRTLKLRKRDVVMMKNVSLIDYGHIANTLSNESIMSFVTLWKDACKGKNASEVFIQMFEFYGPSKLPKKKKTKSRSQETSKEVLIGQLCQSYPLLGLINVAVKSIQDGMWDSMYDTLQTFDQQSAEDHTENATIQTEQAASKQVLKEHCDVSLEDILMKGSEFFKDNHGTLFKSLYKCEVWLTQQFGVENFESLGHGDYLTFLERNISSLPPSFQKIFQSDGKHSKPSLEAYMSNQLLNVLVAQASLQNKDLTKKNVVELLTKQFPLIPFKLDKEGSLKALENVVKGNKSNPVSKGVLFSAALLGPSVNNQTHVSSKDAIEVLIRAPMLTDLNTWSHWDVLFAPSLGPLTLWLIKEIKANELLCLVTKSGNVIRIDHTSTVDSFLEASIRGSSFQTAVNLLSLFALYGGEKNIPLSLLKCHAEKAFKVIMNYDSSKDKTQLNNKIPVASKFMLECLAYLPIEFRSFATDVLLSGFRSIVKDASSVILSECRHTEHRVMLHELGFSLGVMEWIEDHRIFSVSDSIKSSEFDQKEDASTSYTPVERKGVLSTKGNVKTEDCQLNDVIGKKMDHKKVKKHSSRSNNEKESAKIIESIRREEFGLDPSIEEEDTILKKQHARLGRALHCLSQELYSQDSHFLLELVQNADDNVYPCDVEPTLTFILQEEGVIVLNNEQGFSVENIKALCDVGNSTKKEPSAGYIGKKGIGFKSVFRVTDAPEIHSNGFHIKFDITNGQIGFVLPTIVPPCDIDHFSKLVSMNNEKHWNTCIVLPFKSKKHEPFSVENLISMFSDLHPSLLLFLHRLKCIKFRNLLNDSLVIMRKEVVGDGIVNVSFGEQKMTWFVKSSKLQSNHIRHDVQTTEISMALMLEEDLDNGNYIPKLDHQPVFAFLPLRSYGLKFIIQADFILPSSREEVDGDSPWNQWLLSEFPDLFVSAEKSFCSLPSFRDNPAKGISVFMSFVPLGGEVHGFFSCLPRMIISKLLTSNCFLLEGDNKKWVPPCKVLRNWTDEVRELLPDSLIKEHLGVGYLNKDTVLSDSLACALGIEECGPKILLQIMTSLCQKRSLKSKGINWLCSWLNVLYLMLVNVSVSDHSDDVINTLVQLPFILLSDGKYSSIQEGAIWLNTDRVDSKHGLEAFRNLHPKLRIVNSALLNNTHVENITQMLYKVGVQKLSAHEVLKVHILPAISDEKVVSESKELMTEYLSFIMFHFESSCSDCIPERENLLSQVRDTAFISTNQGYKRLFDVPIHFSKEFGNPIDMRKLIHGTDMQWFEIDNSYLKHPISKSLNGAKSKWRKFLQELGVTDFVQIVKIEKQIADIPHTILKNMMLDDDCISSGSIVEDWESQELTGLLSSGDRNKGKHLLEVLDTLWDDYFRDKLTGFCSINGHNKPFKSSILRTLHSLQWLASSMDDQLHFSKDLFHNCDTVSAILGDFAPYAAPKVKNVKLLSDIGLKTTVTLDDALSVLQVWRTSKKRFKASISHMTKLYTYIWNEMSISRQKIMDNLNSQAFIFVPHSHNSTNEVVSGLFLSPHEVFWHDSTGSMEQLKSTDPKVDQNLTNSPLSKMLCNVYPGLHYFFVTEFGVAENPPLLGYLQSLLQLSSTVLPSQAAKTVFQVFKQWNDGMESGILSSEDIGYLKKSLHKKKTTILPTVQDKWVSLHESFGLLCWCDDEHLKKEFKNLNNVDFLSFGDLNPEEQQILQDKISVLLRKLGIPLLSEVVTREAIYYGPTDSSFKASLITWALPYAQRYIYTNHPNEYSQFKNQKLQIIVVENLFYKNIIKRFKIESNKRHDCSCLLQDTILYATRDSDSHSLFLELSRFLIPRNTQLHLANFLHMITTMAESGSTQDQMESFISNSQKLSNLPSQEPPWCLAAMSSPENEIPTTSGLPLDHPPKPASASKKFGTNSSWPPVNWKTAPGFEHALKTKPCNKSEVIEHDDDWIIEENETLNTAPMILEEKDKLDSELDYRKNNESSSSSSHGIVREQISLGPVGQGTPQQVITGRTGEDVAYKYFSGKFGEDSKKKEYIEVKSTSSVRKDWFEITVREWQFGVEKGDDFSIARVVLSDGKLVQITIYKNPVKLCQERQLTLAILSGKQ
ncbi:unnamed protein product [Lactuca saligna]|uniref:Protein NO VEIN C-terminal domain-containing protein n=1 Tax=Lactuca saligna TaxID=75948 RepID=A0AA36EBN2_LACSI|nr:unnamed protein product [Lactuca saligna]